VPLDRTVTVWVAVAAVLVGLSAGARTAHTAEPVDVRFGVSTALAIHPVAPTDLQASWEICIEAVADDWDGPITRYVRTLPADAPAGQASVVHAQRLNTVVLSAVEFLELGSLIPMEGVLTPMLTNGAPGIVFGLVKRRSVDSLEGARCILHGAGTARLARLWLRSALAAMGLPPPDRCFRSVTTLESGNRVVLDTFFGNADLCVVPLMDFETMVELNPAVGRDLEVVAHSPVYLTGVVAVVAGSDPVLRKGLDTVLVRETYRPQVEQLFTLFRVSRLVPFEERHIETVRELIAETSVTPTDR